MLSILYILDYKERVYDLDSAYEIEYLHLLNTSLKEDSESLNSDPDLNPNITFNIALLSRKLSDGLLYDLSDNFMLYQAGDEYLKKLKKEKDGYYIVRGKLSDINLIVFYNCSDDNNCTIRPEDKYDYYYFDIEWKIPTLTHQNPSFPVDEKNSVNRYVRSKFSIHHYQSVSYYFEKVVYKEEKTLFDRFKNKKTAYEYWDMKEDRKFLEDNILLYGNKKSLFIAKTINDHSSYIYYKRKRITFWDIIAKLSSLFQTFYTITFYVYKYYAKNFNNYKLIEKLLQINNRNYRQYEIRNNLYKENSISPIDLGGIKENLELKLINDDDFDDNNAEKSSKSSRKKTLIKREFDEANDELDELLQAKIMPKFSFFRFFCNNLYCKFCCYKYRKQEFLHICDKLILKYLSIDSLLYNQMITENILKDYKWNDPLLYNIEKNELLDKLKNI